MHIPVTWAYLPIAGDAALRYERRMERHSWPRVFAYLGLAVMGYVLADFSTTIATGGIAAGALGRADGGSDLLTMGAAVLLAGVAMMAVFGYLALKASLALVRARR